MVLRNAAAHDSVELVVYYFGATQGGGVDANVARWTAQFNGPGRPEVKPRALDSGTSSDLPAAR